MSVHSAVAPPLVLASTSSYRKALLERLEHPFTTDRPDVDETRLPDEPARDLALRLACAKARNPATRHPGSLIIGSDQTVAAGENVIGKPGGLENARAQLRAASGNWRVFHTAFAVLDTRDGNLVSDIVDYRVRFRRLSSAEIDRYLDQEKPFDCAASMKSEGLGIALLEKMEGPDPTALVGLPLIALCEVLRGMGVVIP